MDLSLVVPCYKEESHLLSSVQTLVRILNSSNYSYEIIFVDDASPDQTPALLKIVCSQIQNAYLILHENNKGRGAAFKSGAKIAKGDVVGFIDIDLEIDALYIPAILYQFKFGNYDIVSGLRYYVYSQTKLLHRHILSSAYRVIVRNMTGIRLLDTETGCKFFNRKKCLDIIFESHNDGWFWDTEVMLRSYLQGLKIYEMPVLFLRNPKKASTVKIFRDSYSYFRDLIQFRKKIGLTYFDRSIIYWHPLVYALFMFLIGKTQKSVFQDIMSIMEKNSSVLDVCSGAGELYEHCLKDKLCQYIGLEWNNHFVKRARKKGIDVRFCDVRKSIFPKADYVVMSSSLYHFHNDIDSIMQKMISSAQKGLIIIEPVHNLSSSRNRVVRKIAQLLSNPGIGEYSYRFSEDNFRHIMQKYSPKIIRISEGNKYLYAYFEVNT